MVLVTAGIPWAHIRHPPGYVLFLSFPFGSFCASTDSQSVRSMRDQGGWAYSYMGALLLGTSYFPYGKCVCGWGGEPSRLAGSARPYHDRLHSLRLHAQSATTPAKEWTPPVLLSTTCTPKMGLTKPHAGISTRRVVVPGCESAAENVRLTRMPFAYLLTYVCCVLAHLALLILRFGVVIFSG